MSNDWGLIEGEWKDRNSDLARKLEKTILMNPEWVVYLRRDARFKCPTHYDQASHTNVSFGDVTCPFCRGFGVKVDLEILPCRIQRDPGSLGAFDGAVREMPGYIEASDTVADFPRWCAPQPNDYFFTAEWAMHPSEIPRVPRVQPVKLAECYLIKKNNPHFEREIVLINCGVELQNLDKIKHEELLRTTDKISIRRGDGNDASWKRGEWW